MFWYIYPPPLPLASSYLYVTSFIWTSAPLLFLFYIILTYFAPRFYLYPLNFHPLHSLSPLSLLLHSITALERTWIQTNWERHCVVRYGLVLDSALSSGIWRSVPNGNSEEAKQATCNKLAANRATRATHHHNPIITIITTSNLTWPTQNLSTSQRAAVRPS
jgi:hypothetical protein